MPVALQQLISMGLFWRLFGVCRRKARGWLGMPMEVAKAGRGSHLGVVGRPWGYGFGPVQLPNG